MRAWMSCQRVSTPDGRVTYNPLTHRTLAVQTGSCAFTDAAGSLFANAPMQRMLGCDERACGNDSPLVSLFLVQETLARQQRQPLWVFNSQPYGAYGITQLWLFCFLPDVDDYGGCNGIFCHARPFPFLSLPDYLECVNPGTVEDWHRFTDRERGIIFLSLQRLRSKRIGQWLRI
ncbi:hypothetical protein SGGMMB4_05819 (plasmid) [Sodalis glossinidius str. 'morsitans']|uniref:Uncharacterized protein n=2 Tax=Sodalis glossinidius TaxID=63612 RepID=A0A193QP26_SODGM|nr:hypothetical protein SGGMMB4_05819 [Sodalis glossinidius str. 'morsitans']